MNKADKILFNELVKEDNVGLVLRGHLHVEHQLTKYIAEQLPYPERVDWGKIDFMGKVELALACGLDVDIRPGLERLENLRNMFAHRFDALIDSDWVLVAYNGLPRSVKLEIEAAYKALGKRMTRSTSTLDTRDLLVLIFISVANTIASAVVMSSKSLRNKRISVKSKA